MTYWYEQNITADPVVKTVIVKYHNGTEKTFDIPVHGAVDVGNWQDIKVITELAVSKDCVFDIGTYDEGNLAMEKRTVHDPS